MAELILTRTKKFLENLQNLEPTISNTTRGEAIHQTERNRLTAGLKEALYEDCKEVFEEQDGMAIIPYITKDGIVLDIPNTFIAENTNPEFCNGSISVEWSFVIKGLEFDGSEAEREYTFLREQAKQRIEKAETEKKAKIAKANKAREDRERKRAKAIEMAMRGQNGQD